MKRRDFLQNNLIFWSSRPWAGGRASAGPRRPSRARGFGPTRPARRLYRFRTPAWVGKSRSSSTSPMFTFARFRWQQLAAGADPAAEAGDVAAARALQTHQTSIIPGHLTNRFCYFRSPRFKENRRDYLAAYLEKSRAAGFRTIVYFNVHAVKPEFGADRPDWRQVRFDGRPLDDIYGIETSFCVNSPWRDWVRDVCLDLCRYPIDGIFFDSVPFRQLLLLRPGRKLYQQAHGREMPPKEAGHPEIGDLASFQSESLRRFLEHSNLAIKSVRPDVLLYCNAGPREEPYYLIGRNNRVLIKGQDILAAEGGFVYGELSGQPPWRVGSNASTSSAGGGKPTGICHCRPPTVLGERHRARPSWRSPVQGSVHGSGGLLRGVSTGSRTAGFRRIAATSAYFSGGNRDTLLRDGGHWRDPHRLAPTRSISTGVPLEPGSPGVEATGSINDESTLLRCLDQEPRPCTTDEESLRATTSTYSLLILPTPPARETAGQAARVRGRADALASFESCCRMRPAAGKAISGWPTSSGSGFSGHQSNPIRISISSGPTIGPRFFPGSGPTSCRRRLSPARSRLRGPRSSAPSPSSSRVGTGAKSFPRSFRP